MTRQDAVFTVSLTETHWHTFIYIMRIISEVGNTLPMAVSDRVRTVQKLERILRLMTVVQENQTPLL